MADEKASHRSARWIATVPRMAVVLLYFVAWAVGYDLLSLYGVNSPRLHRLERPIDRFPGIIQPWTAVIYVFGGLVMPLLPFLFDRSWSWVRLVLTGYVAATLLAFACYAAWPLAIVRPPYDGGGVGARLMRAVFTVDREANCFPSSHTYYALLGAVFVSKSGAGGWSRGLTWALAVAVCITTVTTGQHYFIDVAGGLLVTLVGYRAARALTPSTLLRDGATDATRAATGA